MDVKTAAIQVLQQAGTDKDDQHDLSMATYLYTLPYATC